MAAYLISTPAACVPSPPSLPFLLPHPAPSKDIARGFRSQISEARSLKGASQPEFEEKLNRLKQLRDLRNGHVNKIQEIKAKVRGLDFKTEAELDERIRQQEEKIRFGSIPLREEKMVVQEISKLKAQREKIKEYELQKATLVELEAESAKVKAMMADMDDEFSIIKGERDSASKVGGAREECEESWTALYMHARALTFSHARARAQVMNDFWAQLKDAEKEVEKVEEELKEAVEKKNEVWSSSPHATPSSTTPSCSPHTLPPSPHRSWRLWTPRAARLTAPCR
jgi:hypothetical protein